MTLAQTIMCEQALGLVDRNTLLNLPDFGPNIPVLLDISSGASSLPTEARPRSSHFCACGPIYFADLPLGFVDGRGFFGLSGVSIGESTFPVPLERLRS